MRRPIHIEGCIAAVPLTHGYSATIDAEDVSLIGSQCWYAKVVCRKDGSVRTVYAVRRQRKDGKWVSVAMHRLILSVQGGMEVDHIDGDGLNNRKANLRLATRAQNQQNRRTNADNKSGAKGVTWNRKSAMWKAQIKANRRYVYLGLFSTVDAAAEAYAKASAELHGDFGRIS